jgi:hypothetical protein
MQATIREWPCFTEDWLHITVVFDPSPSRLLEGFACFWQSQPQLCAWTFSYLVAPCTRQASPRPQAEVDTFC